MTGSRVKSRNTPASKALDVRLETTAGEALFGGIVQLGRSLGLEIVAEGIERQVQRDLVTRSTCDKGQGYLFARPQAPEAIGDWAGTAWAQGEGAFPSRSPVSATGPRSGRKRVAATH